MMRRRTNCWRRTVTVNSYRNKQQNARCSPEYCGVAVNGADAPQGAFRPCYVGSAIAVAFKIVDMGEDPGESYELRTVVSLKYPMVARG